MKITPVSKSEPVDEAVAFRSSAMIDVSMVNVFATSAYKAVCHYSGKTLSGSELQSFLQVQAWVRNVDFVKDVFIDFHVFDKKGAVLHRETRSLGYSQPAGGGGDFFTMDSLVYRGSGGLTGGVWPRPEARLIEYRLYYQLQGRLYSDGIAHRLGLAQDVSLELAVAKAA
jgi:hypothetical protein